jgi:ankyrin repeat protein
MAGIPNTRSFLVFLLLGAVFPIFTAAQRPADSDGAQLLTALRRFDVTEVRRLVAAGVDTHVKDEAGASALMYATLYASPDEMRLLLDKGADPNAANDFGSTALMWAAGDTEKIDLLLTRGASVAAKTKRGHTAFLSAANHGNIDAMRLLVARGADPNATTEDGADVQSVALARGMAGDLEVDRLLAAARRQPSIPKAKRDTPLAATLSHPALFKTYLDRKVSLGEESFFVTRAVPTVAAAAYRGQTSALALLLDRGGNVNAADSYGTTPLMMAAGSPRANAATITLLIERGARVDARDRDGRTALDWALLQGDMPVVPLLRTAGGTAAAPLASPPAISAPRSARNAVGLAITRLQPIGPPFNQRFRCISCHNQSLPAIAAALASRRGVPVDATLAAHPTTSTLAMWQLNREEVLLGNVFTFGGFVPNVGYGLLGLAEEGVEASPVTDAVVLGLAAVQNRDGSWWIDDIRPPLGDQSRIYYTALGIRALATYAPPGRRQELQRRVVRARDLLRRTAPANTQDEAFKLLGLVWSNAPAAEVSRQSQRLLRLQRNDGGWAQTPTMAPDAYATGQALYALHSAGTAVASAAYQNGAQYLLRTQLEDGSWFVRSRGFAFQPYFDAGFSHGRDQFISAAATSWAVIALTSTL